MIIVPVAQHDGFQALPRKRECRRIERERLTLARVQ